ncbi:hypothetical protein [Pseudopedobacter beijingensis]|uniref:Uncharacterized protein n=1 Tax=Pseudopedobacter beijingensis TaxID=1207056 RepID=A0ABW4IBV5_9SPHI
MDAEELLGNVGGEQELPKESPLISLQKDLNFYKDTLREVAVDIMVEGLSLYPIFIAHQHQVSIGEIIIDKEEMGREWTVQVSTLEEFLEKGIIEKDKKDVFLYSYKDPDAYACVFAVVPEGANFVFVPY